MWHRFTQMSRNSIVYAIAEAQAENASEVHTELSSLALFETSRQPTNSLRLKVSVKSSWRKRFVA